MKKKLLLGLVFCLSFVFAENFDRDFLNAIDKKDEVQILTKDNQYKGKIRSVKEDSLILIDGEGNFVKIKIDEIEDMKINNKNTKKQSYKRKHSITVGFFTFLSYEAPFGLFFDLAYANDTSRGITTSYLGLGYKGYPFSKNNTVFSLMENFY